MKEALGSLWLNLVILVKLEDLIMTFVSRITSNECATATVISSVLLLFKLVTLSLTRTSGSSNAERQEAWLCHDFVD